MGGEIERRKKKITAAAAVTPPFCFFLEQKNYQKTQHILLFVCEKRIALVTRTGRASTDAFRAR